MDLLSMEWRDMLFAHWPFSPEVVERHLPSPLVPDTRDGRAWVGLVAHRMADLRPVGSPIGRSFVEVNLRTYVRHGDRTGVYFFSLDASDSLAVAIARRLWGLSYYRSEARIRGIGDGRFAVDSYRTHRGAPDARFVARYGPTEAPSPADEDSLAAFLTDRYRLVAPGKVGTVTARLRRRPLPVAPATADVEVETVFRASGFECPSRDPHLLYGAPDGVAVRVGPPDLVRG